MHVEIEVKINTVRTRPNSDHNSHIQKLKVKSRPAAKIFPFPKNHCKVLNNKHEKFCAFTEALSEASGVVMIGTDQGKGLTLIEELT